MMKLVKQFVSQLNYKVDAPAKVCSFKMNVKREEVILIDDDEIFLFIHSHVIAKSWPGIKIKVFKKFEDAYHYVQSNPEINRLIVIEYYYQFKECLSFLRNIGNASICNDVIVVSNEFPERERHLLISNSNVVGLIHKPIKLADLQPYV